MIKYKNITLKILNHEKKFRDSESQFNAFIVEFLELNK